MTQIIDFTGGLNNKLDPVRIQDNQAVVYENIDIISNCLKSLKGEKEIQDATDALPFYFKGHWTFSKPGTSYARLLGLSYRAYDDKLEKTLKGKVWSNLWIQPPEQAPEVTKGTDYADGDSSSNGFYSDDIYYCYTYYNEDDGSESAPSPYSPKTTIGTYKSGSNAHWIKGRGLIKVVKSADPQITHINIYRMGAGILQFQKCLQVENISGTYVDETGNEVLGENLRTIGYTEPPKVSYIAAYYALLFGVSQVDKNKLMYSDEANPLLWNPLNYIIFDEDIVGLGSSSLGLLVFTEYRVYIIYGTEIATFQRYLLYDNIGCKNHNSIQTYNGSVIWQGDDGIYLFDGSNSNNMTLMNLVPFNETIIASCLNDNVYYGLLEDGRILTLDFRFELKPVMMITDKYDGIFAVMNRVYVTKNNKLYLLDDGPQRTLHWKSKEYTENAATILKNYKYIQIYCRGEFNCKVYTDNRLAAEVKLFSGYNEIKLQQDLRLGYTIQFEIEGIGHVLEICYQYETRLQTKGV